MTDPRRVAVSWEVRQADCVEAMREMDEASVDAIVTDPPYFLGFMGKAWDTATPGEVQHGHDKWAEEALRVLKPGGHLLAFGGTRTYHRLACAVEDAGFEIRDSVIWLYGSGFPKSLNLDGEWEGWGTALKPAHEPIVIARKPLVGTVAQNVLEHGTGALNIDGCRVAHQSEEDRASATPQGRATGKSGALAGKTQHDGERSEFERPDTSLGRWPANVALDPEAAAMLDEQSGDSRSADGQASLGAFRNGDIYGAGRDERESRDPGYGDTGGASRFFYCAKASRGERNAGLDGFEERETRGNYGDGIQDARPHTREGYEYRAVTKNSHPTVKPIDLMRWLVRLVTPPRGRVLDPFTGSGTTGCAAVLEDFDFIGIEREPEYVEIAKARIEWWEQHQGREADEVLAESRRSEAIREQHEAAGQMGLEL